VLGWDREERQWAENRGYPSHQSPKRRSVQRDKGGGGSEERGGKRPTLPLRCGNPLAVGGPLLLYVKLSESESREKTPKERRALKKRG